MFEPLKNVLDRVLANKKMCATFSAAETCVLSEKLFAAELPALAGQFRVRFLKNKILHIAATSSSVAAELRLAETTVLTALQKRASGVRSVRYVVGPLPERVLPE